MNRPLRIGAVNYLNSRPLVAGLEQALPEAAVVYDVPSRLAAALERGDLDVALAPCIELARRPEWHIISDACVGCRGPVLSVKLLFRRPPAEVATLALDEGSRTSVVLAQILLAEIAGVRPRLTPFPLEAPLSSSSADAILVIGDRAIAPPSEEFVESWDLGDRWCRWSELPFTFATWMVRGDLAARGVSWDRLEEALGRCRDEGLARLDAIVAAESKSMGLPADLVDRYLRRHLHYYFGAGQRRGLEHYFERAAAWGLLPRGSRLKIDDCSLWSR
jgi:chorismate dehydratase